MFAINLYECRASTALERCHDTHPNDIQYIDTQSYDIGCLVSFIVFHFLSILILILMKIIVTVAKLNNDTECYSAEWHYAVYQFAGCRYDLCHFANCNNA